MGGGAPHQADWPLSDPTQTPHWPPTNPPPLAGHAACTAAAVLGGRHLAAHIDERTVGFVGGAMFLLFGLQSLYAGPG